MLVNTPVPPTDRATQITFFSFAHSDQIQEVADAFNQAQSRVYVANQPVGSIDPSRTWTIPELVAETDLDCFAWFTPPKAGEVAALLDLQPLLEPTQPRCGPTILACLCNPSSMVLNSPASHTA